MKAEVNMRQAWNEEELRSGASVCVPASLSLSRARVILRRCRRRGARLSVLRDPRSRLRRCWKYLWAQTHISLCRKKKNNKKRSAFIEFWARIKNAREIIRKKKTRIFENFWGLRMRRTFWGLGDIFSATLRRWNFTTQGRDTINSFKVKPNGRARFRFAASPRCAHEEEKHFGERIFPKELAARVERERESKVTTNKHTHRVVCFFPMTCREHVRRCDEVRSDGIKCLSISLCLQIISRTIGNEI